MKTYHAGLDNHNAYITVCVRDVRAEQTPPSHGDLTSDRMKLRPKDGPRAFVQITPSHAREKPARHSAGAVDAILGPTELALILDDIQALTIRIGDFKWICLTLYIEAL